MSEKDIIRLRRLVVLSFLITVVPPALLLGSLLALSSCVPEEIRIPISICGVVGLIVNEVTLRFGFVLTPVPIIVGFFLSHQCYARLRPANTSKLAVLSMAVGLLLLCIVVALFKSLGTRGTP